MSASEHTKLLELAKGSYDFKSATIAAKRKKMELKAEQERQGQQYAAEERALVIKERMQEKEFEHRERMIKFELELARLKAHAAPAPPPSQPSLGSAIFSPESGLTPGNFSSTTTNFDNFSFPAQTPDSGAWRGTI